MQYILDKGLIRFAKFVIGSLTIIIAVGVFLYGFDLKHAADEAHKSLNQVEEIEKGITKQQDSAHRLIDSLTTSLNASVDRANQTIATLINSSRHHIDSLTNDFIAHSAVSTAPISNATKSLTANQVAKAYNFPSELNGSGQTIALIQLGGGYRNEDLKKYFSNLNIPLPSIKAVSVDGGKNDPSTAESGDGEVMLDIEVAGAVAPGAKIVVYFAPNTDKGFLDAITQAIHDDHNKPTVISISWGAAEKNWTQQSLNNFNEAFKSAASLGITICASAGDQGSSDAVKDGKVHVDFPASSPYVLACGGTRLVVQNDKLTETVWHLSNNSATGGGISDFFPLPDYQKKTAIPLSLNNNFKGRGLPDVASNADPTTGYEILVDGEELVIGGTAATAPLWAGFIALINQSLGKNVGFINPILYDKVGQSGAFRDITAGDNKTAKGKGFDATVGWDACTGWGVPDGRKLIEALKNLVH